MTRVLFAASVVGLSSTFAHGALQLLQLQPIPVSPAAPEFSWTGANGNFVTGPGAVGNGDGDLAVGLQTSPGLELDTPLNVPGVPNSVFVAGSGTTFYDCTMTMSSINSNGQPTADLSDKGAFILIPTQEATQNLSSGAFSIFSTPATDVPGQLPVLLLSGVLTDNTFSVPLGGTSAGFESESITYTGGAILTALLAAGGTNTGSASISLISLDGSIGVNDTGPLVGGLVDSATIAAFDGNASGVFDTPNPVPEPASLSVIAMAGLMGLRRRRA
jgi:hypothetical protein